MNFEILGEIREVETIAIGASIRDLARLRKVYGPGRWRKVKGIAYVRLQSGRVRLAELHWYEAHGIGKNESVTWTDAGKAKQTFNSTICRLHRQCR